jgi:ferredoxin
LKLIKDWMGDVKMKVEVDRNLCEGHGLCVLEAPEVFAIGEDEKSVVLDADPPEALRTAVNTAALVCPTRAITVEP